MAGSATRLASMGETWTMHGAAQRRPDIGFGGRRASRGTVVITLMFTVATLCTKMLAVDQRPPQQEGAYRGTAQLHRKAMAQRAARQELMFEPLQKIRGAVENANLQVNASAISLSSPLIFESPYKQFSRHYSTPHLPPLPMQRDVLLADVRSIVQALEIDGLKILKGTELEARAVAEQMLVSKFQPMWLRGRGDGPAKVSSVGGGKLGGGVGISLGSSSSVVKSINISSLGIKHNPIQIFPGAQADGDPEIKEFMHDYRHGVKDKNSSGSRMYVFQIFLGGTRMHNAFLKCALQQLIPSCPCSGCLSCICFP